MDFQNDCTGERNEKYQVIPRVDEDCGLNVCVWGNVCVGVLAQV